MKQKNEPISVLALTLGLLLASVGCSDDTVTNTKPSAQLDCSIPQSALLSGGPGKDGIPALTDPTFVGVGEEGIEYLLGDDRVVGFVVDSEAFAIPLNIFWWHEIVNLTMGDTPVSITHCPLTGSTLAFDRSAAGGAEFGVSGLLFQNNLVMYDRNTGESLWPQMLRSARCGPADGTNLAMVPMVEMTWDGWRSLHPNTRVVSGDTGFGRSYTSYPYGNYDIPSNQTLLFPGNLDARRPPKERVLGIPNGNGGIAFPFGVLDELGSMAAVSTNQTGETLVVFWDSGREAAMAFRPTLNSEELTFSVVDGKIVDDQTGSVWVVEGRAVGGTLTGEQLEPVAEAFVAFWFAWPTFYPDVEMWGSA